jgi:hypothetical protein
MTSILELELDGILNNALGKAADNCTLIEKLHILVSQRDNARNEAQVFSSKFIDLNKKIDALLNINAHLQLELESAIIRRNDEMAKANKAELTVQKLIKQKFK